MGGALRRAGFCAILAAAAPAALAQEQTTPAADSSVPDASAAPTGPLAPAAPALPATDPAPPPVGTELGLPGGLPGTPPPVRLGTFFGFPFAGPVPAFEAAAPPGWSLTPSLTLRLRATDNRFLSADDRRADLITEVIPGALVTANTERVQGRFLYTPSFQFFASEPDQSRIEHRFTGGGVATLLPGRLFLDLRGFARVQATSGGLAPDGETTTERSNRARTYALQATPYYIHRFGGTATALGGYAFQYASQQGTSQSAAPGTLPFFRPVEYTSHTGFAAVRSGEDFGRLALEARVSGSAYVGNDIYDGAHRNIGTVEARYAVLRGLAVLAEGGYEDQRYSSDPIFRVQEPVWAVGVRLDPAPGSVVIARYGHRDGYNSAFLNASIGLGGFTRLAAAYSDRLSTSLQQPTDLLTTTAVDEYGYAADAVTGAPALQPFTNSFLTVQNGLFRIKRAFVSLIQAWPEDTVALTFSRDDRTPVAVASGTSPFSQRGTYGTLTWAHVLSPRTTTLATLQYGRSESGTLDTTTDVFLASAAVGYQFSPTLFGSLQYLITNRRTDFSDASTGLRASGDAVQNIVIATLRQVF